MNFEDEPYVRLYTRRTVTNRRLGWEGRAVMHEMLYEFDRAGVFDVDGEPDDAIELVTGLPTKVVKVGLGRLLKSETWELKGNRLVWPKYLEAQTARRSDAVRAAEYRARRRDGLNEANALTDERDEPSRGVTPHHEESRDRHSRHETSLLALPGSALPSLASPTETRATAPVVVEPSEPAEDPGRETVCPLDLLKRPGVQHMLRELAEKLPAPIAVLEAEAAEFVSYWTLGEGIGQRRAGWPRRLRERLRKRFVSGDLKPPGAIEHANRTGRGEAPSSGIAPSPYWEDPAKIIAARGAQ